MNHFVEKRLEGILQIINSTSTATRESASASKGAARADFINKFLSQVMPTSWRISTNGEVTDAKGVKSGELDIIIENGLFPSIPVISSDNSRLFFAEGVAAVIEVKSNLSSQWNEVIETGRKLSLVQRKISGGLMGGGSIVMVPNADFSGLGLGRVQRNPLLDNVPYFVVGYHGWNTVETINNKLIESEGIISGILQLDIGHFCSVRSLKGVTADGPLSLLAFIDSIHEVSSYLTSAKADLLAYGRDIL